MGTQEGKLKQVLGPGLREQFKNYENKSVSKKEIEDFLNAILVRRKAEVPRNNVIYVHGDYFLEEFDKALKEACHEQIIKNLQKITPQKVYDKNYR